MTSSGRITSTTVAWLTGWQVEVGDLVVFRDQDVVLGIARIDDIRTTSTTKVRSRC
ncbi:hypothetical protein R4P64_31935 [Rhodococcus sp. IEGM 1366]|uniref:hypothetical protein n=1 Tax=Rhodococcus sp. IEGM 1366 TaxID=3082223 RepID=UPI0029538A90|nr:hypothetical protein [Rhodococcus sp. IEGM 1366]MDV8071132.1 hypothetical protein [Rhodococcus sp. IEGM 1366]